MAHALGTSMPKLSSTRLMNDLNIPIKNKLPDAEGDTKLENVFQKPQPQLQGNSVKNRVM